MRRLKVMYDHDIFVAQEYGGITRYFLEIATRLANASEIEPKIFSGLHISKQLNDADIEFASGMYVPRIKKTFRFRKMLNAVGFKAAFASWKPDVVHETYYSSMARVPRSVPVIVTIHDMIHELFPQSFPAHSPVREWKRRAIERATAIVCVSETTRRDLEMIVGTHGKEVRVIPHGANCFSPSPTAVNRVGRIVGGEPFFLFVGTRHGYKNFEYLLRAYASSATLRGSFKLVCFGADPFDADERALIQELVPDQGRVIHIAGNDDLLFACYAQAEIFVYPSLYEGFGIPILEAHAAGCPVICSDIEVFREVAGEAAGYFDPTDIEHGTTTLEEVLGDRTRRMRLRHLGTQRLSAYSWAKSAAAHADLYKIVVGA